MFVLGMYWPLAFPAAFTTRVTEIPHAVENALRAGPDAQPANNMHRSIVFQGAFVCAVVFAPIALRGKQIRREQDERQLQERMHVVPMDDVTHGE